MEESSLGWGQFFESINLLIRHSMQIKLSLKAVSRKSKLKLYWTVIRPAVVYGCETWVLKENITQKVSVFERKILRKIFGPTKKERWELENQNEHRIRRVNTTPKHNKLC